MLSWQGFITGPSIGFDHRKAQRELHIRLKVQLFLTDCEHFFIDETDESHLSLRSKAAKLNLPCGNGLALQKTQCS